MLIFDKINFSVLKNNFLHLYIFSYLFFFVLNNIKATNIVDTISGNDTVITSYNLLRDYQNTTYKERQIEKHLNGFQIYFPSNKNLYYSYDNITIDQLQCHSFNFGYKTHLGNLGAATNSLVFENNTLLGTNSGFFSFNDYIQTTNNTKFYNV